MEGAAYSSKSYGGTYSFCIGKNKGKFTIPKVQTPAISLLVSGGYTQLVLMKDFGKYEIIGKTLDDAVG